MKADRSVRWGVLATGGIAGSFTRDLALLPEADVVAVGSRSERAARRFAEEHGIPRAYGSWEELAADPEVDVVYVATPHSAHHDASRLMIEAGKAVLCEKPFTLNLAQARELVSLARSRGVFLMEAMWTYCNPVIRRMNEVIADGSIGEVRTLHADFGFYSPPDPEHRLHDPAQGGGAVLDLGVCPISLAHLVLGVPSSVQAWASLTPRGVDENTAMVLGYDSGAVASLTCSLVANNANTATISGTKGRIELPNGFFRPDSFMLHRGGREPEQVRVPVGGEEGKGYVYEAAEVMRALHSGRTESALVPLQGTLEVMATLDAVRERIGVRYPGE